MLGFALSGVGEVVCHDEVNLVERDEGEEFEVAVHVCVCGAEKKLAVVSTCIAGFTAEERVKKSLDSRRRDQRSSSSVDRAILHYQHSCRTWPQMLL